MKVMISCDMEGISGIVDLSQVTPGSPEWETARMYMVGDVNAAVEGLFAAGATGVIVNDAHGPARNLIIHELDPRAQLSYGKPSFFSMLQGIERQSGLGGLVMIGYHAMAGAVDAVLCHTWTLDIRRVWLNTIPVGEIGLNAALAGHYGIPIVALSGDYAACLEAASLMGEGFPVAMVKQGLGQRAALCLSLEESHARIRQAVETGMLDIQRGTTHRLYQPSNPISLEVEFMTPLNCDRAQFVPGVVREGGLRLRFDAVDMVEAIRGFRAMAALASG